MSLSPMITLPSSSAKGLYSCWNAYSRVASPTTTYSLSPPISPPSSPSLMFALPAGSTNGFYSSWKHYKSIASSAGSGSLSPPMSPPSSPLLHTISEDEVYTQRASWPVSAPRPLSDLQNSDSESRSSVITTSVSYAYSVKSVNSRKSRLAVWYPRPVRPQRMSGVEFFHESAGTSTESLSPLSSRPVSLSMSLQGNLPSIAENERAADTMETLSMLFDSSPGDHSPVERRLSASWKSLLKVKDYQEKHATPNLRTTTIFADTLLCVHNEIVEMQSVGAQELTRPCVGLNGAFEDAYNILYNSGMIPAAPEQIPALDADFFKNSVVTIIQLVGLIRALEVLVDSLAILAVVKASKNSHKPDLQDDDVILNVPGWRQRSESPLALPSMTTAAVDNTLRLLVVARNEELEQELRGLRFLLWRASPRAKTELGSIVKRVLPLHHEELMKSPVEDFVVHWQAAVVPSGQDGVDESEVDTGTDSW